MFTHPQGAFIPETLLPDEWWEDPGAADAVLVPWTSPANPLVRVPRTSWLRDVVMKGSGAVKASKYDPGRRAMSADPLRLQGVVVAAAFVRDEALWPDGSVSALEPDPVTDLQMIDQPDEDAS